MQSAIDQNKNDLQNATDQYTAALNGYTQALTSTNAITKDQYDTYSTSLQDMYTAVQTAPTNAANLQYLQAQILNATAGIAADGTKLTSQAGYIADATKLAGHITDSVAQGGYVLPGIDLVNTINQYAVLEPTMSPTSIITAYSDGVNRMLAAPTDGTQKQDKVR